MDLYEAIELDSSIVTLGGFGEHRILRHTLSGKTPSTVTGKRGEGPGEFRAIVAATLERSGDTLVVGEARRITLLDPALGYARSFDSPVPLRTRGIVSLDSGAFLLASRQNTNLSVGGQGQTDLLHVVSSDGQLLASFSPIDDSVSVQWLSVRPASEANLAWMLVSKVDGFSATLWDVRLPLALHTIQVAPSWWFASTATPSELETNPVIEPTATRAIDMWQDGDVIWVIVLHHDKRWKTADRSEFRPDLWMDTIILAIDAITGAPIASKVLDPYMVGFSNRGHLVSYQLNASGHPQIRLHELAIVRGAPK